MFTLFILSLLTYLLFFIIIKQNREKKQKELEDRLKRELEARLSKAGIKEIDKMAGREFEQYLEHLFRNLGYKVGLTPSSNDFGADLIVEGNNRIVIQAKRYKNKVGVKSVQEINSAKTYYEADEAWVITNNTYTTQAIKLANSTNTKLIDRYDLVKLILKTKDASSQ